VSLERVWRVWEVVEVVSKRKEGLIKDLLSLLDSVIEYLEAVSPAPDFGVLQVTEELRRKRGG
jgi:hypothetical protein